MKRKSYTRRFSSPVPKLYPWLVLVGYDARLEYVLEMSIPCEETARRKLNIPSHIPVLIGKP